MRSSWARLRQTDCRTRRADLLCPGLQRANRQRQSSCAHRHVETLALPPFDSRYPQSAMGRTSPSPLVTAICRYEAVAKVGDAYSNDRNFRVVVRTWYFRFAWSTAGANILV